MDNMENYKYYIEDVLEELINRSLNALNKAKETNSEFDNGVSFGYYEVLNYLLNQAEIFEIKDKLKSEIKNFDPSF